ncbi:ubiquinone/menaquinone biosynthesis C-methylase UbiE [Kitasatospora sp. GAS204A]|uniref:methyltransferase domain-containing protein n=1 Tax=unclassified Kitasatospora TaxID=2633591 RepID=UPI0024769CEC|nr:methyltransferase domain-containing protein [Kitasatospora sp. GAS204B]MDH6119092.1 ubiquinone/menaquinone biosynthesis C-methylase UbiE [Kitasatospora sp. GAS204B]
MSDPRPTSGFHAANADPSATDRLAAALDAQAANPGVRRLREWAHSRLAARPGERALDVGSGTGSETRVLAAAVAPNGAAIGLEPHPGLRALAERRAADADSPARFLEGDALALPLPDADLDVVRCERVLQHLTDPARAVAEIARVLRPGGRVALLDTDWATFVLHPAAPEIRPALASVTQATAATPDAGRRLASWLSAAGLTVDDVGSDVLLHDPRSVSWPIVRGLGTAALGQSLITEEQRDRLYADLTAAAEQGAFHLSVTMFAVVAHRPG